VSVRAILTYHSIDPSGSPISVDEKAFRRHVDWLASGAVEVVALTELLDAPGERDALAITFDDMFQGTADLAWPLLRERGLPATVFVPTGRVGRDNSWGDRVQQGIPTLALADWDTVARVAEEGLAIGSHTVSHAHLDQLGEDAIRAELEGSAAELERRLGHRPRTLCYPYGDYDDRVVRLAAETYALSVTTDLRVLGASEHPHRLPRLDAFYYRENRLLEAFGTGAFRRHLWLRASARRLRRAAGL
jgi:peptidoglycan/xylan/chitin deacetylase (PgdA/CDA1 family)